MIVEVGKVYQVNILNKYWFRGKVIKLEGTTATLVVPTHYSNQYQGITIQEDIKNLREVEIDLTKKDNKYRK